MVYKIPLRMRRVRIPASTTYSGHLNMEFHDVSPAIESTHQPHQDSHVELLSSEDGYRKDSSSAPYPRIRSFLRQFRLGFLTIAFGCCINWRSNTEYRKVAMYHSRIIAAMHGLLHLVPLSTAITILLLHWTGYLVSFTDDNFTMLQLQFAAKLHELFMQASIIEVVFCLVRTQVVDGLIPLGLLSIAMQATQLSYIWSLDYLSIFKSSASRGWRRWFFAIAIPTLILLISLVGPSSATLMIPRSGSAHKIEGVTLYVGNSTEALYPSAMYRENGLDLDITRLNLTVDSQLDRQYENIGGKKYTSASYLSQDSIEPSNKEDRRIGMYDRILRVISTDLDALPRIANGSNPNSTHSWKGNQLTASMPTLHGAASFRSLDKYAYLDQSNTFTTPYSNNETAKAIKWKPLTTPFVTNGTAIAEMWYAAVDTRCGEWSNQDPGPQGFYGPDIPYFDDAGTFGTIPLVGSLVEKAAKAYEDGHDIRYYTPVWTTSPQPGSPSLIGVFIARKLSIKETQDNLTISWILKEIRQIHSNPTISIVICTLSAFWDYGEVQLQKNPSETAVKTLSYSKFKSRHARSIDLNVTDADTINSAQFHRRMHAPGSFRHERYFIRRYPLTLSATFALAISRVPQVSLNEWIKHLGGDQYRFEYRLKDLEEGPPEGVHPANVTTFKFNLVNYGYGYGVRSTSIYLAMAVLLAYSIITIVYIIYTIITGSTSTAWNSGIELVALALQSKKPDHLGHSSVGIDSIKTFGESVGIRVNADDKLELVFAHDRDFEKRGLRKIEWNKEY